MSPMCRRGIWLWAGVLSGMLCLIFLPLSAKVRWVSFLLVAVACLTGVCRTAGRKTDADFLGTMRDGLPEENYRLPLVLVCGDGLTSLFGNNSVHRTAQGCWLREESSSLFRLTRQLLRHCPEWANQLAVMLAVNPQQHSDERALSSRLRELRWQLVQIRRDARRAVPLVLCSTVATSTALRPVWLSRQHAQPDTLWSGVMMPQTPDHWQRHDGNTGQTHRLQQTIILSEHNDWLQAQVLSVLQAVSEDMAPVSPQRVILHQVAGIQDLETASLWQCWLVARTALPKAAGWHPVSDAETGYLLFPDFIFSDLPPGSGWSSRRRMLHHGVTLLTLTVAAALCCSAWHNRQLLHRIAFDIRHYDRVKMEEYGPKAKAVEALHQNAAQLDAWFRNGEPLRLGLGLYQGERLRLPLFAAIKTYVPPLTPPPSSPSAEKHQQTVRLDALSLFDSGKYQLKPNSTKMLVNALIGIKAQPGRLIVVSGHTDITGDAQTNHILSLKRAEALRDWMLSTSDVSPTCFAVQGYGATRPVATNDTAEGRAANRRVEINLMPQADACQAAASQHASND